MGKKKEKEQQSTQVAVIMPDIFKDVDFTTLNASITALATHNGALSDKDKEFAVQTIATWEDSVISRLNLKATEASNLLQALDTSVSSVWYLSEDEFEALVVASGTESFYETYLDAIEELEALKAAKPEQPVVDLDTTLEEQLVAKRDYELAYQKSTIQINRAERNVQSTMKSLKVAMNQNDSIKELVVRVRKYQRNVNKFKNECTEKSQLAKISVTISSQEIRDALKDLLNFSIAI